MLGEQPPATGEAAGAPRFRLVCAQGTGLAWLEAIGREGARQTLACKSEVTAQAVGRWPQSLGQAPGWSGVAWPSLASLCMERGGHWWQSNRRRGWQGL